ncbi:MAG TPA: hypothetical protein DEF61_02635 [Firmicutes bacterium]|nr:hypothetical protein [Bacillota bacterium]
MHVDQVSSINIFIPLIHSFPLNKIKRRQGKLLYVYTKREEKEKISHVKEIISVFISIMNIKIILTRKTRTFPIYKAILSLQS